MGINSLEKLLEVKKGQSKNLAVVACHDEEVLEAVVEAYRLGIAKPILVGDREKTLAIGEEKKLDLSPFKIVDEKDLNLAAEIGVKMVRNGEANFIMKGLVDTSILLKAVLNKEWGLRTDSLLSHVMVYEIADYHKLIYLTDGGMNLAPGVDDKVKIIENAALVARAMGNKVIKVACLAAKEKVDTKMQATVDAGELKSKYQKGEFSKDIVVEGPMALDLAVSSESAKIKGYKSEVAGDADILLVPNIEMGNGIGKSITYFAGGKSAGIVMGAKAPIVLVSRADNHLAKLYSIALGSISAGKEAN
ncbi:MAG: bifunctional enoyl-CoA hydratase/phosphate acetyltransferase [Tissierellaceae bacterium]